MRSNGKLLNSDSRWRKYSQRLFALSNFAAGQMISSPMLMKLLFLNASFATLDTETCRCNWKDIELLAAPDEKTEESKEEEEDAKLLRHPARRSWTGRISSGLQRRTFRIAGVINTEIKEGAGQGGLRGLMPSAGVYVPYKWRALGTHSIAVK